MKVSEFFENNIPPFLLGAFYGKYKFSTDNTYIYTYSSYKNWTKLYNNKSLCQQSKPKFIHQVNEISKPYGYWMPGTKKFPRADIVFALENDLHLTQESFFNKLNKKILNSDFIYEDSLTEAKKMFIRGFAELRGSLDRNRNLFTMDYVKNNQQETKRVRLLIDNLNVPVYVVNYNFREFQPDYCAGRKRETQLRFNIFWYATNIGFINEYRTEAFKHNFIYTSSYKDGVVTYFICTQPLSSDNTEFENRLAYYAHNVFNKNLTKSDAIKFKQLIGLNTENESVKRNLSIVNMVKFCTPDICVSCFNDYDIKDRSHIDPKTGRYYFEIHHMISMGKNKDLDDVDNLAKLCPACHRSLSRGSADENFQKNIIRKIFENKPNLLDFSKSYFDENDFEKVVDLVWMSLK